MNQDFTVKKSNICLKKKFVQRGSAEKKNSCTSSGFSLYIFFLCSKNVCNVLNTALQVFNVVTKNRRHLRRHTFKKRQKYLYNGKNLKKIFLYKLRCFNVLLHLDYKILLCEPKIEFTKSLATDHRVRLTGKSLSRITGLILVISTSVSTKI